MATRRRSPGEDSTPRDEVPGSRGKDASSDTASGPGAPRPEALLGPAPPTPPPPSDLRGSPPAAADIEEAVARFVTIDAWKGTGWVQVFDPRVTKRVFIHFRRLPEPTRAALRDLGCPLMWAKRKLHLSEADLLARRERILPWITSRLFRVNLRRDEARQFVLAGPVVSEVAPEEAEAVLRGLPRAR